MTVNTSIHRKKLIEVALPLEAINVASAREKSIRHGHPSTLHLWWARRPLAACRAVIFTSLVDDPDDPDALPAFVEACRKLPKGKNVDANSDTPRMRLFDFIERLVTWEATTDEAILNTARELILIATEGNPPPLLDPFAGGGSIPLEAQRLGLEAHASDLNPVAVMINKAQIEIPPRFANRPPVNPRDIPLTPKSPLPQQVEERGLEKPEHWHITPEMRQRMTEIARHLRKNATPSEDILWQALRNRKLEDRKFKRQVDIGPFVLDFYCPEERLAVEVDGSIHALQQDADKERQKLIESLGIRFVRISAGLVETNLPAARQKIQSAFNPRQQSALPLASRSVGEGAGGEGQDTTWRGAAGLAADVRYYGEWMREKAWEKIGHLYPKYHPSSQTLLPQQVGEKGLTDSPRPAQRGRGAGGEGSERGGETVIAWLWARTVKSPNPAVNAHVPLVRSFILSKKKGRECWANPIVEPVGAQYIAPLPTPTPAPANTTHTIRFEVTPGTPPKGKDGTVVRTGATDIISGEPIPFEYIREEGKAGRMGAMLMAIVTEGQNGRSYYSPTDEHARIAESAEPEWIPMGDIPEQALGFRVQLYGMDEYNKLFTPRQLVALTTFSDLVAEAREQAYQDALTAGLPDDDVPLHDGGRGALAYSEAVSVYLAFGVDKSSDYWSGICSWHNSGEKMRNTFGRQAIPMVWDYAEANPFSQSTGNWMANVDWIWKVAEHLPANSIGYAHQQDAAHLTGDAKTLSTDPPYYDNIGYADLSDFFYVWMRRTLRSVYPEIFSTLLVPKAPELIASPYRHGGKDAANAHFEGGMLQTFANIRRFVMPEYPLTVYYAFKQQDAAAEEADDPSPPAPLSHNELRRGGEESPSPREAVGEGLRVRGVRVSPGVRASTGWETMLTSLIAAGFSIDGTWPIRTELSNRMVGMGSNALASSIVLVCRPRLEAAPTTSRRAFVDVLRRELPAALQAMQSGNIAPVDLAQAAIGPGMAIYSRYSQVLEADGSPLTVRAALQIINQELDAYFSEQDGDIDSDTRFAVAWFEQNGFEAGEYGRAETLATAKNVSVSGIERAGLVVSGKGKVRLIHWSEYDPSTLTLNPSPTASRGEGLQRRGDSPLPAVGEGQGVRGKSWNPQTDKRPTVWEATHHLIERLHTHGETGSAALMTRMPSDMAAEARQLAYRLYNICERKGWADHARDYNALVISWAEIGTEAARLRQAADQGDATVQGRLFDNP